MNLYIELLLSVRRKRMSDSAKAIMLKVSKKLMMGKMSWKDIQSAIEDAAIQGYNKGWKDSDNAHRMNGGQECLKN